MLLWLSHQSVENAISTLQSCNFNVSMVKWSPSVHHYSHVRRNVTFISWLPTLNCPYFSIANCIHVDIPGIHDGEFYLITLEYLNLRFYHFNQLHVRLKLSLPNSKSIKCRSAGYFMLKLIQITISDSQ